MKKTLWIPILIALALGCKTKRKRQTSPNTSLSWISPCSLTQLDQGLGSTDMDLQLKDQTFQAYTRVYKDGGCTNLLYEFRDEGAAVEGNGTTTLNKGKRFFTPREQGTVDFYNSKKFLGKSWSLNGEEEVPVMEPRFGELEKNSDTELRFSPPGGDSVVLVPQIR
jgi:hypothetical protein